jgi:SAM-dependent methyltransferase
MGKKKENGGARNMDRIAKTVFAPVYPITAEQILDRCGISRGRCLDIGSGPGSLGIALAQASDLSITLLDSSPEALDIAEKNVLGAGLSDRISLLQGDVHDIPLPTGSMDLVVSRGSIFFWDDLARAFSEIYRVLSPGGKAYVGGGFGNAELRDSIAAAMAKKNPDWKTFRDKNLGPDNQARIAKVVADRGLPHQIISDDSGFWVMIEKDG